MRIGFDARMMEHAGIGRYISSLLPELVKQSPEPVKRMPCMFLIVWVFNSAPIFLSKT